jgi:hypothetical protein
LTVATAAGVTIGITSVAPATFTRLGWEARTFTTIGEITDLGEFGRAYAKAEHKPIATRETRKLKASYDEGAITLGLGLDNRDAGQLMAKAAAASDSDYYFCITLPSGERYFFSALVLGFKTSTGSADNIVSATITLEITGLGILEVPVLPSAPGGFVYLVDTDINNTRLTDPDGAYLMEPV